MKPPKETVELDFAKRTAMHTLDYRGCQENPPRPKLLQCDYCNTMVDRLWIFKTRAFSVQIGPKKYFTSDAGSWGACVYCEPMARDRDVEPMIARAMVFNAGPPPEFFRVIYSAVFAAYDCPVPFLWQSGDPWPVEFGI